MRFGKLRVVALATAIPIVATLLGCGGGSSSSSKASPTPASNSQAIMVNAGPANKYANGLFTTVTVCVAGTTNCQNISGVLVDTASFGLRVLASALTLPLAQQKDASGKPVVECAQFADGFTWGPVKTADVKLAGEQASSIPIQVIGDPAFATIPASCSSHGPAEDTLQQLGTNGVLGVGPFVEDCGNSCVTTGTQNPDFYFGCTGSSCQVTGESISQQVRNPVASFAADNNGVVIDLPAASASAPTLSGSMIFGIGTQSNNSLGSAQVLTMFLSGTFAGNVKTTYKSTAYSGFFDSGSNAYFFLDASLTGIPDCPSTIPGFYCPSSPASVSATNAGANGVSNAVNFTIDNAATLFSNSSNSVFPTLGGPNPGFFDWGVPFFYGRRVFTAIAGRSTPGGAGPYWAY